MDHTLGRAALGPAADPALWRRLASADPASPQVREVRRLAARVRTERVADLPADLYGEYDRTGDRQAFERPYLARRVALAALALEALLDPDGPVDALAATLDAVVAEPRWALPAHTAGAPDPGRVVDLFAAETGSALAEITALLGDRLPRQSVVAARAAALERVVDPYEQDRFWWEVSPTNWASVCAGAVALTVLQLGDRDRMLALAPRVRATLARSLDGYGEDGVCVEGFGYWRYGFGYHLVASQALDDALGPDPEGEPARAAAAARWQQRAFLSGRVVVPFADTWVTDALDEGLLVLAAHRYGGLTRPDPAAVGPDVVDDCGRWALALRSLAWTAAAGPDPFEHDGEAPRWYPDAGWLVVPEGDRSPIGLAARGGHNGEPHNHCDLGSFGVAAAGELLVGDAGRGVYDRAYFGPERYDNPAAGSQGHPVPLVDDVVQAAGDHARAAVLDLRLDHAGERLVLDLTAAYPHPALRRLVRTISRDGAVVVVRDELDADAPVRLTQRVVTLAPPEVVAPGCVRVAGERATATLTHDAGLTVDVAPLPVGRGGFERRAWRLDLRAAAPARRAEIVTTLAIDVGVGRATADDAVRLAAVNAAAGRYA